MIVLITGGASGLGEAMTRRMAQDLDSIIYFTYSKSADSAIFLESKFPNTRSIKCDFRNAAEVKALTERIAQINLDVLINNAFGGPFMGTHFHKTLPAEYLDQFNANVVPTITLTQAAINCFRQKKFGRIITILTSALSETPPIGASVYVANKAYLFQLVKVWAAENGRYNVTSNAVSPSFMLTNFTKDVDERMVDQIRESSPNQKLLTTGEVAESVYSLSQASQDVNGVNVLFNIAPELK